MSHLTPFGSSLSRTLGLVLDKLEPNGWGGGGRLWRGHSLPSHSRAGGS